MVDDLDRTNTAGVVALQHRETGITAFAFREKRGAAAVCLLSNGVRSWGREPAYRGYGDKVPVVSEAEVASLPEREQMKWRRPLVRELYSYSMRGADVFAQRLEAFRYNRRHRTWKKAVRLYHFSMALCNAFLLFTMIQKDRGEKPLSHYGFLEALIEELWVEMER